MGDSGIRVTRKDFSPGVYPRKGVLGCVNRLNWLEFTIFVVGADKVWRVLFMKKTKAAFSVRIVVINPQSGLGNALHVVSGTSLSKKRLEISRQETLPRHVLMRTPSPSIPSRRMRETES